MTEDDAMALMRGAMIGARGDEDAASAGVAYVLDGVARRGLEVRSWDAIGHYAGRSRHYPTTGRDRTALCRARKRLRALISSTPAASPAAATLRTGEGPAKPTGEAATWGRGDG